MTRKTDEVTKAGAVALNEGALERASGGAPCIKFDGIDGKAVSRIGPDRLKSSDIKINLRSSDVKL